MQTSTRSPASVIGILSHPTGGASGTTPLANLVAIVAERSVELHVITGTEGAEHLAGDPRVRVHPVRWERGRWIPLVLLRYLALQLRAAREVASLSGQEPLWIFFIDGQNQLLPFLAAKALRRPVILIFAFSAVETLRRTNPILAWGAQLLSALTCTMADRIVVYSPAIIDEYSLTAWKTKITIASEHHIDLDLFAPTGPFDARGEVIGYIGRFNEEKGILRLLDAIPLVLREEPDARFLLVGTGLLRPEVEATVAARAQKSFVELVPWVDHGRLPAYLNRMRLLVIPSFTEGLPNAMLESMACGTPVLAAPVGAIPDVIVGRENGFLLADTKPATIAAGIIEALRARDLNRVSDNARRDVGKEFSYERAAARFWRAIELDESQNEGS